MSKPSDFLIFGIHPVEEALSAGKTLDKVLIQQGVEGASLHALMQELRKRSIPYSQAPKQALDRVTRKNHQGIIAFVSPVEFVAVEDVVASAFESGQNPLILVLDRVTDVRNFGALCRTAEAMGCHAVVFPGKNAARLNEDAVKASAGALLKIPLCKSPNLKYTLAQLKASGLMVVACTEKSAQPLWSVDLTPPLVIIMGNEEEGISGEYLKLSDHRLCIPMAGTMDSLNVGVAAGMILSERSRQCAVDSNSGI